MVIVRASGFSQHEHSRIEHIAHKRAGDQIDLAGIDIGFDEIGQHFIGESGAVRAGR